MKTHICFLSCTLILVACTAPVGENNIEPSNEPGDLALLLQKATPTASPLLVPTPIKVPAAPPFNPPEILTGLCDSFDDDLHEHEGDLLDWQLYRDSGDEFTLRYPPD